MLFNSLDFAVFFPVVFILYWFVCNKNLKAQNALLFLASYFFYACWDWRFLFLLLFSTLLGFLAGIRVAEAGNKRTRKSWFVLGIVMNLGVLGVFKYYDFFASSFAEAMSFVGWKVSPVMLHLILPVGISFYTFHGLSYIIDVYKGKIKEERNFVDYAVFVSFFPLLVAGPIERATHLLPQIKKARTFDYSKAADGLRQILWGFFKKMVIADNCGFFANMFFENPSAYSGSALLLGALFFTFQVYGDFTGYSDIALGVARLLGIELLQNFSFPYFSRTIPEFWRRWHISLSGWFRDYVYYPLGGSRGSTALRIRNIFIIFLISGLWHGANWTFIVWALLNAVFYLPLLLTKSNKIHLEVVAKDRVLPSVRESLQMMRTFGLRTFTLIFFRADTVQHALAYISGIFTISLFSVPHFLHSDRSHYTLVLLAFFLIVEWQGRANKHALEYLGLKWKRPFRWFFYTFILFLIAMFMRSEETPFIYFQF